MSVLRALGASALVTALWVTPAELAAQSPLQVGGAATFERYAFAEEDGSELESISLLSLPFEARAELASNVSLTARGAWAQGRVAWRDGTEMELSGPTDTELRLSWELARRAIRVELLGYLPSGKTTHDAEEAVVAGIIAADLLPFRISNWGSAGSVGMSVSGARRFGKVGAGAAVAYRVSGDFDPVQDQQFVYEPGDELQVRLGLDYALTRSQKLSLALSYRSYEADIANETNLFQTGDRMIGLATWSFPTGRKSAGAVYSGILHREQGTFLDVAAPDVPSQNLVLLGGMMRAPLQGGFIVPRVDARVIRQSGAGGDGFVIGAGAAFEAPVGQQLTLLPTFTARFGSVEPTTGVDAGFTGFDVGLIARFGPRGR